MGEATPPNNKEGDFTIHMITLNYNGMPTVVKRLNFLECIIHSLNLALHIGLVA